MSTHRKFSTWTENFWYVLYVRTSQRRYSGWWDLIVYTYTGGGGGTCRQTALGRGPLQNANMWNFYMWKKRNTYIISIRCVLIFKNRKYIITIFGQWRSLRHFFRPWDMYTYMSSEHSALFLFNIHFCMSQKIHKYQIYWHEMCSFNVKMHHNYSTPQFRPESSGWGGGFRRSPRLPSRLYAYV